jgi:hypothetical protein
LLALASINVQAQPLQSPPVKPRAVQTIWQTVTTPDIGSIGAMSADGEDNIWAVGIGGGNRPFSSLHFNGSKWSAVPMVAGQLRGVAVVSPVDVWAVGQNTAGNRSLIEHFDGLRWTVVPSPHFTSEILAGISAIAANNIYAVGSSFDPRTQIHRPLIEHFDGTSWTVVPIPVTVVQNAELFGLAVVSAADIWAVGGVRNGSPLALHFNGRQWRQAPVAGTGNLINAAAISSHDVWAVGVDLTTGAITEHWDGVAWRRVPSPPAPFGGLARVAAISSVDVWATGCNPCGDVPTGQPALIEHWNGVRWTISPAPALGQGDNGGAVLAFPSGSVYVGGSAAIVSGISSFILHTTRGL